MNARQKAKKYKKIAELYRDKAKMYDIIQRTDAFHRYSSEMMGGTIEKVKVSVIIDDRVIPYRVPEEVRKRELAKALAESLLQSGLIHYEKDPEGSDKIRTENAWIEVVRKPDPVDRKERKDIEGTNEHL